MSDQSFFHVTKGTNYDGDDQETSVSITVRFNGIVSGDVMFEELDRIVAEVKRVY